jgi:hypothetical protein
METSNIIHRSSMIKSNIKTQLDNMIIKNKISNPVLRCMFVGGYISVNTISHILQQFLKSNYNDIWNFTPNTIELTFSLFLMTFFNLLKLLN